MIVAVPATLAKLVAILKLGLRNTSKRIKSLIFLNIHTPPTTTYFDSYNSLSFKIIYKGNSKFGLKVKGALHTNWRKPKLNVKQNHLALTLSL